MYRILFFLAVILITIVFGWWLFIPMSLLFVYLSKSPYEIIFAGLVLDCAYYFGEKLIFQFPFTSFSILLIILILFLSERFYWSKVF